MWKTSLLLGLLVIVGVSDENPQCPAYWSLQNGMPCTIPTNDFNTWYNLPMYDVCGSEPPYSASEAALGFRVRKNVEYITEDEEISLMKALACAQHMGNTISNSSENTWPYVATFHGAPRWFPECYQKGCCLHSDVRFPTWHRLLMLQFENSLRRWNLSLAVPYWNWANSTTYALPELATKISFTDPITNITYKNPWWNYRIPKDVTTLSVKYAKANNCSYTCRNASRNLFEYMDPRNKPLSFYRQLLQSYEFENWVVFDFMFEIPHNNLHNLVGGSFVDLDTTTFDPMFMLHHMGVERYFTVWQNLTDYRGVNYRPGSPQIKQYLGCFITQLGMLDNVHPFANETTNGDPITRQFSNNSFDTMRWEEMHYQYDPYPEKFFGPFEDVKQLASYLHNLRTNSSRQFLGWYLPSSGVTYHIDFRVREYGKNKVLTNGSFAKLGLSMYKNEVVKYLHRIEITDALKDANLSFNTLVEVDYHVTTDSSKKIVIPYPASIVQDKGQETYRFYWGSRYFNYSSGNEIGIILGTSSISSVNEGQISVQLIKKSSEETSVILYSQYAEDVRVDTNKLNFVNVTVGGANVSVSTLKFDPNVVTKTFYDSGPQTDYDSSTLTRHGKNTFEIGDSEILIHFYLDQASFHGFHGEIFNGSNFFRSPELGHAVVPLDEAFLNYGNELYNRTFLSYDLQEVDFLSCDNNPITGCLVNETGWKNCDVGTQCFGSFPIINGDGIRYFVANNKTLCERGMKIAFDARNVSKFSPPSSQACAALGIGSSQTWTSRVLQQCAPIQFGISLQGNGCQASYWISGPSNFGWFATAIFGPYHLSSSDVDMKGLAIVATNTGNYDDKGPIWGFSLYLLTQKGSHVISEILNCTTTINNGNVTGICNSTFIPKRSNPIFGGEFLQFMPSNFPPLEVGHTYNYLTAWRNTSDPSFTQIHTGGCLATYTFDSQISFATSIITHSNWLIFCLCFFFCFCV